MGRARVTKEWFRFENVPGVGYVSGTRVTPRWAVGHGVLDPIALLWSNFLVGSAFQIHLLLLSDGRPHPLATVDQSVFHIDYRQGKAITKFNTLIGECILVVVVAAHKGLLSWKYGGIFVWDWRNGHRLLVSAFDSPSLMRGLAG